MNWPGVYTGRNLPSIKAALHGINAMMMLVCGPDQDPLGFSACGIPKVKWLKGVQALGSWDGSRATALHSNAQVGKPMQGSYAAVVAHAMMAHEERLAL